MRTEALIAMLVADRTATGRRSVARRVFLALLAGALPSLVLFFATLGLRQDFVPALATWRFDFKLVLALLALVLAFGVCRALAQPIPPRHPGRGLLALLALVVAGVVIEMVVVPPAAWSTRLIGSNALICTTMIPLLSLAPLAALVTALRSAAPASPVLAGAAAGLLAAAGGATLYAFHCFDDSPLFVATWYTLATIIVVAIGAVAGHRLLRW
jgi:hypothetical protein